VCVDEVDVGRQEFRSGERLFDRRRGADAVWARRRHVTGVAGDARAEQMREHGGAARRCMRLGLQHQHGSAFAERESVAGPAERLARLRRHGAQAVEAGIGDAAQAVAPPASTRSAAPSRSQSHAVAIAMLEATHALEMVRTGPRMPCARASDSPGPECCCDTIRRTLAGRPPRLAW
jgi:hypothetical protein